MIFLTRKYSVGSFRESIITSPTNTDTEKNKNYYDYNNSRKMLVRRIQLLSMLRIMLITGSTPVTFTFTVTSRDNIINNHSRPMLQ